MAATDTGLPQKADERLAHLLRHWYHVTLAQSFLSATVPASLVLSGILALQAAGIWLGWPHLAPDLWFFLAGLGFAGTILWVVLARNHSLTQIAAQMDAAYPGAADRFRVWVELRQPDAPPDPFAAWRAQELVQFVDSLPLAQRRSSPLWSWPLGMVPALLALASALLWKNLANENQQQQEFRQAQALALLQAQKDALQQQLATVEAMAAEGWATTEQVELLRAQAYLEQVEQRLAEGSSPLADPVEEARIALATIAGEWPELANHIITELASAQSSISSSAAMSATAGASLPPPPTWPATAGASLPPPPTWPATASQLAFPASLPSNSAEAASARQTELAPPPDSVQPPISSPQTAQDRSLAPSWFPGQGRLTQANSGAPGSPVQVPWDNTMAPGTQGGAVAPAVGKSSEVSSLGQGAMLLPQDNAEALREIRSVLVAAEKFPAVSDMEAPTSFAFYYAEALSTFQAEPTQAPPRTQATIKRYFEKIRSAGMNTSVPNPR